LFDVPGIGEDFAICGGQLVGAMSEYFYDDEQALPWWRQLVAASAVLFEVEH
jgi:hypothetical protein